MILWVRAIAVIILLSTAATGRAQQTWSEQRISSGNGLPQSGVHALAFDTLDYLWLATDGGLVRYAGQDIKRFDLPGGGAPRSERMRSIITSPGGEMLVFDSRGAIFLIHAHHLVFPVGEPAQRFTHVRGGFTRLEVLLHAMDVAKALPGRLSWSRSNALKMVPVDTSHWAVFSRDTTYIYRDSTLLERFPSHGVRRFSFATGGRLYSIDSHGQATTWGVGERTFSDPEPVMGWRSEDSTMVEEARFYWRSGDAAPVVMMDSSFHLVRVLTNGRVAVEHLDLPVPRVSQVNDVVWSERQGALVVALAVGGIHIYRKNLLRSSGGDVLYAQLHLGGDSVLGVTVRGVPAVYTRHGRVGTEDWLPHAAPNTLARLPDGRVAYTMGRMICATDPRTGLQDTLAVCGSRVTCLQREGDTLWVGSETAIGYFAQGTYTELVDLEPVPEPGVFTVRRHAGELYFGLGNGLFRLQRSPWRMESVVGFEGLCTRALTSLGRVLLVGTYGDGAHALVKGTRRALPMDRNGFLSHTHGFIPDAHGRIWMPTNHGLFHCERAAFMAWCEDPTSTVEYTYLGTLSGLSNVEFNGGCEPSYTVLPDGTVCLPSIDGLVRFEPGRITSGMAQGAVLIENMSADDFDIHRWGTRAMPTGLRQIVVQFSVSFWGDPLDLRMEYRLREEDAWLPLDRDQRGIVIPEPQPGDYEVEVRLAGAVPGSSAHHAVYFRITEPWYRTLWGRLLLAVAMIALITFAMKYWSAHLRRRNASLETAVLERTSSLSQANAELQLAVALKERLISIVTHDIVSPLRFIAQVARDASGRTEGNNGPERTAMGDIQFAAEKLHGNALNLLNWMKQQEGRIRPVRRTVVPALVVDDLFERYRSEATAKGLRLENDVPIDDVIIADQDLLGIALSNLLMNAVTYTSNGLVRVSGGVVKGRYYLVVADTGPGLSPKARERLDRIRRGEATRPAEVPADGIEGLGYVIVAGIMELLGGAFEVVGEGGSGTTIVLELPVQGEQGPVGGSASDHHPAANRP